MLKQKEEWALLSRPDAVLCAAANSAPVSQDLRKFMLDLLSQEWEELLENLPFHEDL